MARTPPLVNIADRQRRPAQVHSGSTTSDGHVKPVVHQDPSGALRCARRSSDGFQRGGKKRASAKVLLADLHRVNARGNRVLNRAGQLRPEQTRIRRARTSMRH